MAIRLRAFLTLENLAIVSFCLLRLLAMWAVFLLVEIVMFKSIRSRLKSKTYWLAAAVALVPALPGVIAAAAPLLGENAVEKAGAIVGVLIAVTREFTKAPVSEK